MSNYTKAKVMLSFFIIFIKTLKYNFTHYRHFTLVYLFGDNQTTVDTGTAREPSIYVELPCFLIEVGFVKMFIVTFLVQVVERCKTQNVNDQLDETFELFVNN